MIKITLSWFAFRGSGCLSLVDFHAAGYELPFYACWQNCEKLLLVSSGPSVSQSVSHYVHPRGTARPLIDGFSLHLVFGRSAKIC
jgi:hypothetical protein